MSDAKFGGTNRSVAARGRVGGYWNDDDPHESCSQRLPRQAVAAGAGARCQRGRAVLLRGEVDGDLLQAKLPQPASYAEAGSILPNDGAGRGGAPSPLH